MLTTTHKQKKGPMNHIEDTVATVLTLTDLRPNATVNAAMTNLVNSVIKASEGDLSGISTATKMQIKQVSAAAETEMENYWAKKILTSKSPHDTMQLFPYSDNYVELTKRELTLTQESGTVIHPGSRVLVIGSGALPLSALEIHRQSGATVDHVDISRSAILLSSQLCQALGVAGEHFVAAGSDVVVTKSYDLILIAALAGDSHHDKQVIIDNLLPALSRAGRIIVRSARGARTLLYSAIDPGVLTRVTLLKEYHPTDHVINSVFVYKRSDYET